ncbi:MAG: tripartite tricarboxylate transporter substrate binding protein [Oscillospiraceae bacterium]|nr:tripartite tricarboxylate transporter substrate binding protein [Oscillospiraceae bacterium]
MKKIIALALCVVMAFALCGVASADWSPEGPVTMIVSYKAGSGTDNTARVLAKYAEKYVGQTIVIENVEGGSGSIGWSQLADADADGETIGFIKLPNFSSSIVNEMGTYTVESFAPICNHVTETSIVIVRADDDRFPDLEALVEYGKANEGTKTELLASTNGPQASNHIGAQAFANSAGFMYTDIPQGGTADQLLSLRGAEADFSVVKLADIAGQEAEYRILAVFAEERLPELPDVPTLGELGYYEGWLGSSRCIVAPAGVSEDVVKFYEEAFKQAMEDEEYIEAAEQAGMATDYKDAEATGTLIEQQQAFAESLAEGFWYDY